ncbi:MAG: choice-of-anchor P family protein, partial [Acidimicrobiales bacterium]
MIPESIVPGRPTRRRSGLLRAAGVVVLTAGSALGSFALFAGPANAATGPDTLSGSAFGASIEGPIPLLPPTPSVTLPASGTASSTTVSVPLNPVLTNATLTASTSSTNNTLATEQVTSQGRVENAKMLISGSTVVLAATALDSTCTSNAKGS